MLSFEGRSDGAICVFRLTDLIIRENTCVDKEEEVDINFTLEDK